jgi:hypothetical protein
MSIRYRTVGSAWYGLQLPYDRFGNLSGWVQTVNNGGSGLGAYNTASIELRPYGANFAQLHSDEQLKAASEYGSAELADGTNVQSMETLGMLRGNAAAVDRAIQRLEDDSLSLDPAMNTQIAVLNKTNAASIASVRSTRDTNRLLLSTLEQQVTESKRRRDVDVSEINTRIARLEHGDEAKAEHTGSRIHFGISGGNERSDTEHSKFWSLLYATLHDNEEYGYLAVYLRLRNLVPPSTNSR